MSVSISLEDVLEKARLTYMQDPSKENLEALVKLEKQIADERLADAERELKASEGEAERQLKAEMEVERLDREEAEAKRERESKTEIEREKAKSGLIGSVIGVVGSLLAALVGGGIMYQLNKKGLEEQEREFNLACKMEKDEDIIFKTTASRQRYKHKILGNLPGLKK